MYICICNAVSDVQIKQCIQQGAQTIHEVRCLMGVGSCCGKCIPMAKALIHEITIARPATIPTHTTQVS